MRIDRLWIVTKPGPEFELSDMCFETNARLLAGQFQGGLKGSDIHGLYTEQPEAEREAQRILAAFKGYEAALREVGG